MVESVAHVAGNAWSLPPRRRRHLRANHSLADYLVATGRPVHVVDLGEIGFGHRRMGFEDWLDRIPYLAPIRAIGRLTGGRVLSTTFRAAGGLPGWAVRASFKATALRREVTKPLFLRNLGEPEPSGVRGS